MNVAVVGRANALPAYQDKWLGLPKEVQVTLVGPAQVHLSLRSVQTAQSTLLPHKIVKAWMTHRMSATMLSPFGLWRALFLVRPDVVEVEEEPSSITLFEVLLLKQILGYRVVFYTWENLPLHYRVPFSWMRRLALKWADGAIVGNSEGVALLRQAGFDKPTRVQPLLGLEVDMFTPADATSLRANLGLTQFTIGYVGRIVEEKGLATLINALAKLNGEWQLLMVGRGPYRAWLEGLAEDLRITGRICWVDVVPYEQIAAYFNAMHLFVLPSLTTSRWKEQFGHVLIEAMACEIPVVGSNSGAIPEVIQDAGMIFPEGDVDALADILLTLRQAPTLCRQMGQKGRKRVLEHYTNQQILDRTIALWREVIQS